MPQVIGKYLLLLGFILILAGLLLYFLHDKFQWLGRLPGDIRIEQKNIKIFIPVTTMLVVSLVFSLVWWILRKWL